MSVKPISFRLSDKTMRLISENTKLTSKELKFTTFAEAEKLMIERGSYKKPNPIIEKIKFWYISIGEKLGFIKRYPYSFFDD